jgi:manganese/iron transport system permease protein
MPDLLAPLAYTFVQRALLGSVFVGIACATIGVFVVLRGLAFLGDAISHAAFPGVVIAFLLKVDLVIGGSIAAVVSALTVGLIARRSGLREDVAIGVVFSGMFALGVVLFSSIKSYTGDLLGILFGDVLGVSEHQLAIAAVATFAVVGALWLLWKELVFVSFDPTGAAAAGVPVLRYDALLLGLIGVTIAISVQVVGIVLVVAMLVTPAATARLVAGTLRDMVALGLSFAVGSAVVGIAISYFANTASGATIVLVTTAFFALVWLLRAARLRLTTS